MQENLVTGAFTESETKTKIESGGHRHTIWNFSAVNKEVKKSLGSASFKVGNKHSWQIVCYPGGETDDVQEYVSLFLGYRGPDKECSATWRLTLVNHLDPAKNRTRAWLKGDKFNKFLTGRRWGWQKFIKREDLLDPAHGFIKDDKIVFEASLDVFLKQKTKMKTQKADVPKLYPIPVSTMNDDFENMLDVENFYEGCFRDDPTVHSLTDKVLKESEGLFDVNFVLDNGKSNFRAHSQILAARSPVLMKLFSRFKESRTAKGREDTKVINIQLVDVQGNIFTEMLRYIYSDRVDWEFVTRNVKDDIEKSFASINSRKRSPANSALSVENTSTLTGHYSRSPGSRWRESNHSDDRLYEDSNDNNLASISSGTEYHNDGIVFLEETNESTDAFPIPVVARPVRADSYNPRPLKKKKRSVELTSESRRTSIDNQIKAAAYNPNVDLTVNCDYEAKHKGELNKRITEGIIDFALALYEAADKYELNRLRLMCEHKIAAILEDAFGPFTKKKKVQNQNYELFANAHESTSNGSLELYKFSDILEICDRHNSAILKGLCISILTTSYLNPQAKLKLLSDPKFDNLDSRLLAEIIRKLIAPKDDEEKSSRTHRQKKAKLGNFNLPDSDGNSSQSSGSDVETDEETASLRQLTMAQLRRELSERGYVITGSKDELVSRLKVARNYGMSSDEGDEDE